jgi:hypothetical protein
MTPKVDENILDVMNETPGNQYTKDISASKCRSFDCLQSAMRTTAVSLPSAACPGLVSRVSCTSNVLPLVLITVWYKS